MYSVVPLCLVRAAILAVWDAPTITSLHPPSPAVGRPLSRLILGRSVRLRQCRVFSSLTSEAVILSSVASDTGAMFAGKGLTGAGTTVLAFCRCLIDSSRSREC